MTTTGSSFKMILQEYHAQVHHTGTLQLVMLVCYVQLYHIRIPQIQDTMIHFYPFCTLNQHPNQYYTHHLYQLQESGQEQLLAEHEILPLNLAL